MSPLFENTGKQRGLCWKQGPSLGLRLSPPQTAGGSLLDNLSAAYIIMGINIVLNRSQRGKHWPEKLFYLHI